MSRLSAPEVTILRKSPPHMGNTMPAPVEEHAVAPIRIGIGAIGRHHPSFVQLYYAIEARRSNAMPLVIQFISPSSGTGASLVAGGYARVAADDSAQPVLYVDCNASATKPRKGDKAPGPPTLFDALRRGVPLAEAIQPVRRRAQPGLCTAGARGTPAAGLWRRPLPFHARYAAHQPSGDCPGHAADRSARSRRRSHVIAMGPFW